jgi:hypothetical protein
VAAHSEAEVAVMAAVSQAAAARSGAVAPPEAGKR